MNYDQLLFSELRLVAVSFDSAPLTEENLVRAMTVNEELLSLGYTLSPKDLVILAKSADAGSVAERVRSYAGDVKAKPMYPDFPSQVMEISEAVFRFHQIMHYLSTYGVEEIQGIPVTRGWLPDMQDTPKEQPDDRLLSAKVLALIDEKDKYAAPYRSILTKTERMTDKELPIIAECVQHLTPDQMAGIAVTFKQNLLVVFHTVFADEALSSAQKIACLSRLCQHTGDVWKCMDYSLTRCRYHFRTSQKRLLVKLLESYPISDFRGNLILSLKKRERTLLMLKYLDFNAYSRSRKFADAVAELRAGSLRSWESEVKALVGRCSPAALDAYAQRPGMMLRHLTYLLRNGYAPADIFAKLKPQAGKLKTQTLVSLISHFSEIAEKPDFDSHEPFAPVLSDMLRRLLTFRLAANHTPLHGKKVFLQMPDFDLDRSELRVTSKSKEGGYIRSGLAYRIPEGVRCIRFFVYWNDRQRVDIDLHATAAELDGKQINVGWNADYRSGAIVFSGDITHSDAAEYIDIDLDRASETVSVAAANINLYSGYKSFGEIEECFVGAMAVAKTGTDIKLYNPQNCFFTHYLTGDSRMLNYGYIDVQRRLIVFDGIPNNAADYYTVAAHSTAFSVSEYLRRLFAAQDAELTDTPEAADVILVMGKPSGEKELSLIDSNFFMES